MNDRTETLQEIRDANDEWRSTFDAMDEAVALLDAEGRIQRCNKAMAAFVEKSFAGIIGHACRELCFCLGGQKEDCPIMACKRTLQRERSVFNRGGQWFEVSADPIVDESGQLQGAVHILKDITEHKQMEEALKAAVARAEDEKAKTESIIEAIGDGVSIQDRNFRVLYQNLAHRRMVGGHVGAFCYSAYEKHEHRCVGCGIAQVFADGGTHIVQRSAPTDRGQLHVEITASPLLDSKGNIVAGIEVVHNITERKKAEDALRLKQYFLSEAQRIAHIGSWERDLATNHVIWSDELFRIFGLDPDKTHADFDTLLNLIHPDDREKQRRAVTEAINSKQPYSTEFRIQKHDGSIALIHSQGEVVCDESGRPVFIRGTAQDITERKQAEDELKESEERYRSVIENAFDMIQSIAPDGRILYVNPAWLRIMGYSREELSNKTIFEIIHPACQSKCSNVFSRLSAGSSVEHFETQFTSKDGRVIDVEGSASVNMADGKVKSMQCLLHDVTERKRLEEELFRSQQDWEYTFNSITDMVTVHDKDFNIILANKAAEKILGLPLLEKLNDRKCFSYYHGTDHAPEGCPSCGCLQSGESASFEVFEPHLNMFIEIRAIPRFDSSRNLIGLIHVVRDITERKKAEAERERLHHEKELLHEQLLQSQKMEAVGTLAGGIAHDFNNILNVIMGYGGLLESMPAITGTAKGFLSEIISAADRAAYLTRGLLAFSRKQHLELKPADLNDIIRSITAMLHRVIGEDIKMNIELCKDTVVIVCDTMQVEQIIVNLASNARDAMPSGGQLTLGTEIVELDEEFCSLRGFDHAGRFAVMRLTDTGIGMDEETRERIFEPFFTTKAVGKGTGLGLSIIYGIVAQHRGFLECESEPGHGTVFTIYLPLAAAADSAENDVESREYAARGRGELVLIAEDDVSGRRLLRVVLEHQGYRVIEAASGIEVIERFREHAQDIALMLLDVIMPDMNGYDAYEMIKQQYPDTKAILMSGYTADILEQRGIKELPVSLLKKPVSPHELLKVVREVMDE
ncbi:MAG: PAS domain S-box protein [Nitrospirae bacterium]|nr:PAS domain S-box protein [Nitrospirota bacterium]